MAGENAKRMTIEEHLVQTLKDDKLYALIGDEDAITELVKRSINEALFQPQRIPRNHGGFDQKDSLVVDAARKIASRVITEMTGQIVDGMMKNPETKKAIAEAICAHLPVAIERAACEMYENIARRGANQAIERLRNAGVISPETYQV